MDKEFDVYLRATPVIDADHPSIQDFVRENTTGILDNQERVIALYYAVRDQVIYDPYTFGVTPEDFMASHTLETGRGWCVPKAILYAACARAIGIPARLGFADVRNHLATENLRRMMGTDVFYWHGYTSLYLNGQWIKATPAFNLSLCEKFRLKPLEFDGLSDSIYHPFDLDGHQHMEYLNFRGEFADLPLEQMRIELLEYYPALGQSAPRGDFQREVDSETATR